MKSILTMTAAFVIPFALGYGLVATALHTADRSSGHDTAAAPTLQCGAVDEDTKRCAREGLQDGIPGGAVEPLPLELADSDCPKGSRECFPEDRVGLRG